MLEMPACAPQLQEQFTRSLGYEEEQFKDRGLVKKEKNPGGKAAGRLLIRTKRPKLFAGFGKALKCIGTRSVELQ